MKYKTEKLLNLVSIKDNSTSIGNYFAAGKI